MSSEYATLMEGLDAHFPRISGGMEWAVPVAPDRLATVEEGIRADERARLTAQILRLQKAIKYLHRSEHGMTIGEKNQIGLQEGDLDDPS